MNPLIEQGVLKQHLIDPTVCIRCNTCEATCPVGAITHDDRNYVVKADVCNGCMACVAPCPTGSIDHWHPVALDQAHSIQDQLGWDELPELLTVDQVRATLPAQNTQLNTHLNTQDNNPTAPSAAQAPLSTPSATATSLAPKLNSTVPPWSAAHPYTNLYTAKHTAKAKVTGNLRITGKDAASDTHHVVLDFGNLPFPVLEGQSIGIIPKGQDAQGKPHHARQYSIASPRDGERPKYNNVSITVKRVTEHQGAPYFGVGSNYVCDLNIGDEVDVIGPFGTTFLMPNHPAAHLLMICTGTGSAPMRAFTERVRRQSLKNMPHGKLLLFFGARTQDELPYFGPLTKLPSSLIDVNLAFSRTPNQPKTYVQDLMLARSADVAKLLHDPNTYIYVCGLKGMESGVLGALEHIVKQTGLDWANLAKTLCQEGRLHLETY